MKNDPAALYALTNSIQPLRRAWLQAVSNTLGQSGISNSLATAVLLVSRRPEGTQQNTLAEDIGINPGALVRTLDQGEASGLLERREVKGNRRVKEIHVLPKGKALAQQMEQRLSELRAQLLGDLPAAQIEQTTATLRLFEDRINQYLRGKN